MVTLVLRVGEGRKGEVMVRWLAELAGLVLCLGGGGGGGGGGDK